MYEFARNSPWKLTILKSSPLNFGATITAVNSFPVSSVQFSHSVMSDSLQPHGLQHSRPPCPLPAPRVYSDSCPLIHSKCSLLSSFCMFNFKLVVFVREIEYFLPYQWIRLSQSSLIAALQSELASLREFREEKIPTIGGKNTYLSSRGQQPLPVVGVRVKSLSRVWLFGTTWTVPGSPVLGIFQASPDDLPYPGIERRPPALRAGALPSGPPGKAVVSPEETEGVKPEGTGSDSWVHIEGVISVSLVSCIFPSTEKCLIINLWHQVFLINSNILVFRLPALSDKTPV